MFAWFVIALFPGYLTCSDPPRKSDAVVLFVGPGQEARLDEAMELIRNGYARYLVIPAYDETLQLTSGGKLERVSKEVRWRDKIMLIRKAAYYRKYFEDTHVEALEAKRMLDEGGFRSAILVSSPYHMRRIRMIAGSVFRKCGYSLSFVPTRFEPPFTSADWWQREKRQAILLEFLKIGWFLVYRLA